MATPAELHRAIAELLEAGSLRGVLATVIRCSGSAPQTPGAKLLVKSDGTAIGTVGGGAIEAQVLQACHQALLDGTSRVLEANLVRELGMCCGGSMEIFIEVLQAAERLLLVGAGHVAQAVAPLAHGAGFRVQVVDDREALLGHAAFEKVQTLELDVDELDPVLVPFTRDDYALVMTRDHARDEIALGKLLARPHRYIGMLGSRRKVHTILTRVAERAAQLGHPAPDTRRVRAPVGLALGGRTPAEIAISIVAELIAVRRGGDGTPMSTVPPAADVP